MKFSIITVVKNNKASLMRAAASIKGQSYKNYEHIMVDGASTDGTLDFIKEIADDNTKWKSEPDDGIYDAINKGIKLSTGDIIGLLHSDDFYADENVLARYAEIFTHVTERLAHTVKGSGLDSSVASLPQNDILRQAQNDRVRQDQDESVKVEAVYSDLVYIGKGLGSGFKVRSSKFDVQSSEWKVEWKEVGEPANRRMGEEFGKSSESVRSSKFDVQSSELNKWLKDQKIIRLWKAHSITKNNDHRSLITDNLLRKGWMPPHPTLFLRKDVFEKYGLYRTDMKIAADYEMILRLFYKYKVSSYYLPVVTYCMTTGGASNKSIGNIITKSSEDLKALKMHGFRFPLLTLFYKNLKKIPQFF